MENPRSVRRDTFVPKTSEDTLRRGAHPGAALFSSGLLAFAHAGNGAMVKRLNVGRGAEGGVAAADPAVQGFNGPSTVLEGEGGFLRAFCPEFDLAELTRGLGTTYETMNIMIKRYACHITAHTPVEAMLNLRKANGFTAADIASITVERSPRVATVNNIPVPADALLAQSACARSSCC